MAAVARRGRAKKVSIASEGLQCTVQQSDMCEDLQKDLIDIVREAFCETRIQKDIASLVKKKLDTQFPQTTWHAIVGQHFACSVTHATRYSAFLNCAGQNVLIFKTQE